MALLRDFFNRIRDPFKLIAILSLFLAILNTLLPTWSPIQRVVSALLLVLVIVLVVYLLVRTKEWYSSRRGVNFFPSLDQAPDKYRFAKILPYIAARQARLEIVARTAFRLLCGDENALEAGGAEFKDGLERQQEQIIRAIKAGGSIHLILQNPHVPIPFYTTSQSERLRKHAKEAAKSFEAILAKLPATDQPRLTLAYTNEVVDNSMTRIVENGKVTRLIYDITTRFKPPASVAPVISKPVLVFEDSRRGVQEFCEEFEYIRNLTTSKSEYDRQQARGIQAMNKLLDTHPHYSKLRGDNGRLLARVAACHYLAENGHSSDHIPPPVSVQLLLTNQCTTNCKMCDHYKLYAHSRRNELTMDEVRCVLDCVKDIGTKAVIISGGEPLARADVFEILQYAKTIGLSVGLLTNGIPISGKPLSQAEASALTDTCSWIQMSIDSFNPDTYARIRNGRNLDVALDSLRAVVDTGYRDIEVCYTVQADNIGEVKELNGQITRQLPGDLPVRVKFAHGPTNGTPFLCSADQLREALTVVPQRSSRLNFDYLLAMIDNNYFSYEDLATGTPVKTTMLRFSALNYTCQALRLTCKIDAEGDVYPCCFLFDDNHSDSSIRSNHKLGTLRSASGRVMPLSETNNPLAVIWHDNPKLQGYRRARLPVDTEACSYCSRHFYQNEFLNKLFGLFMEYHDYGLAQGLAGEGAVDGHPTFWV